MGNKVISQRTHTRLKFEPLQTSCHLVSVMGSSPLGATYDTTLNPPEYVPDRSVTPTVLRPDIRVVDPDRVFRKGSANEYLSLDTIAWFVDDEPIASVWQAGTDYDIVTTADDMRGTLRIYKNIEVGEKASLRFKGEFLDWRTGAVYAIESDDAVLSCVEKGENELKVSVDKPTVVYDPLYDELLLWEYKHARGIATTGTRAEAKANGKSYEQEVNILLTDGGSPLDVLPTGMTMRLVELGDTTAIVPGSVQHPEIVSVTFPKIEFDMRLLDKGDYEVQFLVSGQVVASCAFGAATEVTMPVGSSKPRFGADLPVSVDWYRNFAMVNLAADIVEYPELYYLLTWHTQARRMITENNTDSWIYGDEKDWQLGEEMSAAVAELGLGLTEKDNFFDVWFDIEAHATRELLLDESNAVLTDESNVALID